MTNIMMDIIMINLTVSFLKKLLINSFFINLILRVVVYIFS